MLQVLPSNTSNLSACAHEQLLTSTSHLHLRKKHLFPLSPTPLKSKHRAMRTFQKLQSGQIQQHSQCFFMPPAFRQRCILQTQNQLAPRTNSFQKNFTAQDSECTLSKSSSHKLTRCEKRWDVPLHFFMFRFRSFTQPYALTHCSKETVPETQSLKDAFLVLKIQVRHGRH